MRRALAAVLLTAVAGAAWAQFKPMKPKAGARKKGAQTVYTSPLGWKVTAPKPPDKPRFVFSPAAGDDGAEVLYLFPPKVKRDDVEAADEAAFKKLGAIKIEAMPMAKLDEEQRKDPTRRIAGDMADSFKENGRKVKSKKGRMGAYKSVRLDVTGPAMTHVVLEGKQFVFIVRTARTDLLNQLIRTLKEVQPEPGAAPGLPPGVTLPPGVQLPGMAPGEGE